uniref:Rrf2 family transcriptional regulator n=1 Tax=Acidobacterium capsulatum TaxID=33075 RepID=A0A7V4XTJ2_9BACT
MAVNTRFATGVHAMVLLAAEPDTLQTSETIAGRLETNPVVVRRVFSLLHHAGLVDSHKGPSGGSKLARPAKQITLADIYKALDTGDLFHTAEFASEEAANTASALHQVFKNIERSLRDELSKTTLSQIAKKATRKAAKADGKKHK